MKKIIYIYLFSILFIPKTYASDNFYDLFMQGNKEEAILLLQDQVTSGNNDANYILALLYNDATTHRLCKIQDFCTGGYETEENVFDKENGTFDYNDYTSNYKKAYEIFLQLYENEQDPRAAYAIGEYYDDHWVFWPNYKKAFKYYLFAAERGVPEAQYNVANMYEFGDGVKKDLVQSVRWYLQCNIASLCGAGVEGIDDLISQLTKEEYALAKSLVKNDIKEVDIRITSARQIVSP